MAVLDHVKPGFDLSQENDGLLSFWDKPGMSDEPCPLPEPSDGHYVNLFDLSITIYESIIWAGNKGLLNKASDTSPQSTSWIPEREQVVKTAKERFEEIMFRKVYFNAYLAPEENVIYALFPNSIPILSNLSSDDARKEYLQHIRELLRGADMRSRRELLENDYTKLTTFSEMDAQLIVKSVFMDVWEEIKKQGRMRTLGIASPHSSITPRQLPQALPG